MFGFGPIELLFMLLVLLVPAALLYGAYRFIRAQDTPALPPAELAGVNERLARLEEHFQALTASVEQIAEGQRFTTTVLAERGAPPPPEG